MIPSRFWRAELDAWVTIIIARNFRPESSGFFINIRAMHQKWV